MDNIFLRLVKHFGTQELTAEALGVDQSTVSGWVRGTLWPRLTPGRWTLPRSLPLTA